MNLLNFTNKCSKYTYYFLYQFVTDPDLAAKRKLAKQQKKKETKKRKLDTIKGNKVAKKRRKKVELDNL